MLCGTRFRSRRPAMICFFWNVMRLPFSEALTMLASTLLVRQPQLHVASDASGVDSRRNIKRASGTTPCSSASSGMS